MPLLTPVPRCTANTANPTVDNPPFRCYLHFPPPFPPAFCSLPPPSDSRLVYIDSLLAARYDFTLRSSGFFQIRGDILLKNFGAFKKFSPSFVRRFSGSLVMGAVEDGVNNKAGRLPGEARRILLSLASSWDNVTDSNALQVIPLKGAMTNEVYQIKWPTSAGETSRKVLVRIYGEGVEVFFDRASEIQTFEFISKHGQGPRLLGRFPNGRIEEFIHARDYEYASYNPVTYDIANHFCEMAADYHTETPHILDYSKYPSLEKRKRFLRIYLGHAGDQPNDLELEVLVQDVEKYTLASHLLWGLWGIISEHVNEIDFDYMEYARQRFQQYWLRKPELLGSSGPAPDGDLFKNSGNS
ncbi:hypothetical protein PVL29_017347 [Vitis rotundifolia]|uniref:Choline kinase 2 n=1 Tax=Vitis rotundifolia TaxID=103349 RepID=A0AA39DIJ3_VITRO|nr:hypothetical protein PVL29_017347 [Vitis rotundifolia]